MLPLSSASRPLSVVSSGQSSFTSTSSTPSCAFPLFVTVTVRMVSEPAFIGPNGSEISTDKSKMEGISRSPSLFWGEDRGSGMPCLAVIFAEIENFSFFSASWARTSIPLILRSNDSFEPAEMVSPSGASCFPSNGMLNSNSTVISVNPEFSTKNSTLTEPSSAIKNGFVESSSG